MDKKIIKINNKNIQIIEKKITYENSKSLDKKIAKQILLKFKRIAENNKLDFLIFYGTLLGAYRENDFIDHDFDIDVLIFDEDLFLNLISSFENVGLNLVRYTKSKSCKSYTTLYSLMDLESETYIDLYVVYKEKEKYNILGSYITFETFDERIKINFLDCKFEIPKQTPHILETLYGTNWKTPIPNKPGDFEPYRSFINSIIIFSDKFKRKIKRNLEKLKFSNYFN